MATRIRLIPMGLLLTLLTVTAVLGPATSAWGHRGHRDKSAAPESAPKKEESPNPPEEAPETAPPTVRITKAPETPGADHPEEAKSLRVLFRQELFAHMHNKIVHFPIALGLMGAVLALMSLRWAEYESAARLLIFLAAVSALGAYLAGQAQAEPFEGSELEEVLEWHERLGVTTTVLLWLGLVMSWAPPSVRHWRWVWAILVLAMIPVTGFFGGILAHGG